MLKAIETRYNGYRFRSRLEARWAVFFDTLGVPYEYEKEGFDLEEAGWYLPDFWLPSLRWWVEIKGDRDGFRSGQVERRKVARLAEAYQCVVVAFGEPAALKYGARAWSCPKHGWHEEFGIFVPCAEPNCNCLLWIPKAEREEQMRLYPHTVQPFPKWQAALDAARQARFEHGEVPA